MMFNIKKRILTTVLTIALSLGLGSIAGAQKLVYPPTNSCAALRGEIAAEIEAGVTLEDIEYKYEHCFADNFTQAADPDSMEKLLAPVNTFPTELVYPFPLKKGQKITNTGSVYWEAIEACGYHPQREELDCSIEIRQRNGYAGVPATTTMGGGSHEWMLFCVDFGAGLVPVHMNSVHVHDEPFGQQPTWSQGVVVQSNPRLTNLTNNGQTLRGRAILSWLIQPTGCGYIPIWGNQADFRFKLDP